jgi:hypothetical protein
VNTVWNKSSDLKLLEQFRAEVWMISHDFKTGYGMITKVRWNNISLLGPNSRHFKSMKEHWILALDHFLSNCVCYIQLLAP